MGNKATYVFDALNRNTVFIDALGNRTTSVYNAASNLTASIDARNNRTTLVYDQLNRVVAIGEAHGPRAGFDALAGVDSGVPRYAAVAAYLHERAGALERAAELYAEASRVATSVPERDHLTREAARVRQLGRS